MSDRSDNEIWKPLIGTSVVVDTDSRFMYLGTLKGVEDPFILLSEVDVHDRSEGPATNEQYVMDSKRFGIKANRKEVSVRKAAVVSLSKLEDVILY